MTSSGRTSWWQHTVTSDGRTAEQQWRPTSILVQVALTSAIAVGIAILARRVDVLVLATPFVVVLAWSLLRHPDAVPQVVLRLEPTVLQEGESCGWHAHLEDASNVDHVVAMLILPSTTVASPAHGEIVAPVLGATADLRVDLQCNRWGRRRLGQATLSFVSPWNAFKLGPQDVVGAPVLTTPTAEQFTLAAPAPHPEGLVGLNRSRRQGDGSEFADIRPFRTGDRLRHIHWPVSARTGELHVRTMYADQDAEVHLVVDATQEVGISGGIHGEASSADLSTRAAAALARHLLQRGERVGLTAYGTEPIHVPVGLGPRQLRRIVDSLAMIRLIRLRGREEPVRPPVRAGSGSLIILLSPLIGRDSVDQALRLSSHGHTVVVVDCLPPDVTVVGVQDEPNTWRAWRLRQLERETDLAGLQHLGIPVVPWRGPGSLDLVLRRLAARPRPRAARR